MLPSHYLVSNHHTTISGDIAKEISKKFKELSEEERAKWDEKAAEEKKRYQSEMADYSAPEGDDDSDGGAKKKPKKDPNAPKVGIL